MPASHSFHRVGIFGVTAALVLLFIMIAVAVIFDRFPLATIDEHSPAESWRYGGIIIPGEVAGQCRQLQFDNATGAIHENHPDKCRDGAASSGDPNSTENRMTAIRRAFSNR